MEVLDTTSVVSVFYGKMENRSERSARKYWHRTETAAMTATVMKAALVKAA
ncbi:hypothetical protein GI364_10010 [Alicyclobacillus sp. SO9]|nr:hypothetical protein GI364_10010 [Alicyclobacillus sp. SO9]